MTKVYPDYYREFKCIADKCRHNCCIGWEIDIDPVTDEFYKSYAGSLSDRFQKDICREGDTSHFILKENERCPFLNNRNLCDIITEAGEDHLCTICREHPRFHNELPDRTESGLGMCCEEAARLILSHTAPVALIYDGNPYTDDEIIILRDKAISILQDRSVPLKSRCKNLLDTLNTSLPRNGVKRWADVFLSLERLNETWTDILNLLKNPLYTQSTADFDQHIKAREHEYEQLAVYLIYRHMANAPDIFEAEIRGTFAVLCTMLIYHLGAAIYNRNGSFTPEEQAELCRMFSAEIEYSDENIYMLFDELS